MMSQLSKRSVIFGTKFVYLSYFMLVDRNLKHLLTVTASAIFVGFIVFPATAQSRTKTCFYPYEKPVLRVDKNTVICRNPNHTDVDNLTLYRYCNRNERVRMSNVVSLTVNADKRTRIGVMEWEKCGVSEKWTAFTLIGRKFLEWNPYAKPDAELMNRYRNDVTRLLNTLDKYPMQKPTF